MKAVQKGVPDVEKDKVDDSERDEQDGTRLSDEELDSVSGGALRRGGDDDLEELEVER